MNDVESVGRVRYIEPTLLYTSRTEDGKIVDITPPLEDYCIWAELICYSPSYISKGFGPIKVTYINKQNSTFVSFMNGSGQVYQRADGSQDEYYNYLSTDPYDFTTIQDLENGIKDNRMTNECFGINSIDITYDSYQVPQVTIEFTDIRGVSLFGMEELAHPDPTSTQRVDNTSGSFFKCFFTFPYPRFYLQVKGFYGQPVSFDLTCYDFKARFDYKTGNFAGTARFVGYSYGILNDIPLTLAVVAASTESGKAYWESRVSDGAFLSSNGSPLITFTECLKKVLEGQGGMDEATEIASSTVDEQTAITNIDSIGESVVHLRDGMIEYLKGKGYQACTDLKAAKDKNRADNTSIKYFMPVYDTEEPQKGFLIYLSTDYIGSEKLTINDSLKPLWEDINAKLSSYPSLTIPAYPNDIESMSLDLTWLTTNTSEITNKLYGGDPFLAFNFSSQYSSLKSLRKEKEQSLNESIDRVKKERMDRIANSLGFYPSAKNITKILIAHMETFIKLVMDVETDVESMSDSDRSVVLTQSTTAMQSTMGNAAFPILTSSDTADNTTREVECWMGALSNGDAQPEVKLIEELIKAVEDVTEDLNEIKEMVDNQVMISDNGSFGRRCAVLACDIYHDNDYWGALDDDYGFADFVGRVMLRIGLNAISPLILGYDDKAYTNSGLLDALNFKQSHPFLSDDIKKQLETSASTSIDNLIKIVTGDEETLKTYGKDGKTYPWTNDKLKYKNILFHLTQDRIYFAIGSELFQTYNFDFSDLANKRYQSVTGKLEGLPNEQYAVIEGFVTSGTRVVTHDGGKTFVTEAYTDHKKRVSSPFYVKIYKDFPNNAFSNKIPQVSEEYGITEDITSPYSIFLEEKISDYKHGLKNKRELFSKKTTVIDGGDKTWKKRFDEVFYQKESNGKPKEMQKNNEFDLEFDLAHADINSLSSYGELNNYTTLIFPSVSYMPSGSTDPASSITQSMFDSLASKICAGSKEYSDSKNLHRFHVAEQSGDDSYCIGCLFMCRLLYTSTVQAKNTRKIALVIISYYHMSSSLGNLTNFMDWNNTYSVTAHQCPYIEILIKGAELYFKKDEKEDISDYKPHEWIFVSEFIEFANSTIATNFLNEYTFTDDTIVKAALSGNWKDAWAKLMTECQKGGDQRPYWFIGQYTNQPVLFNNEKNPSLIALFQALFKPCLLVWGFKNEKTQSSADAKDILYYVDKSKAQLYLDSFFDNLRKFNDVELGTQEQNTNVDNSVSALSTIEPTTYTDDVKLSLYKNIQSIYKRWLMSGTMPNLEPSSSSERWREWTVDGALFKNWYFLDTYYTEVGDLIYLDLTTILKLATSLLSNPQSIQLFSFISILYKESGFSLQCIQNFLHWGSEKVNNNLSCIFRNVPYHEMDKAYHPSAIIAMWAKTSEHGADDKDSAYKDDGFYFDKGPLNLPSAMNSGGGILIPAFGVSVGKQYQHYFTDVSVSTETPTITDVSLTNMFAIANAKYAVKKGDETQTDNTLQVSFVGQDLYNIYTNQSYSCQVTMMGCCWIQPLMYFQLNNVAMFKGAYMIQKVSHQITPGQSRTTFTGQRMAKYQPPYVQTPSISHDGYTSYGNGTNVDLTKLANTDNNCPYKYFEPLPTIGVTPFTEEILNMTLGEYETHCGEKFASGNSHNISIFDSREDWEKKYNTTLKPEDELYRHKQMNRNKDTVMDLLGCVVATECGGCSDLNQMLVLNQIFNRAISRGGDILFIAHGQNAVGTNGWDLYEEKKDHFQEMVKKVFLQSPLTLVGEQTYVNSSLTNGTTLPNGEQAVAKTLEYLDVSTADGYVTSKYYWESGPDNLFKKPTVFYNFRSDEPAIWGHTFVKGLLGKGTSPYWSESDYQQVDTSQEYTIDDVIEGVFSSAKKSLTHSQSANVESSLTLSKNGSIGTVKSTNGDLLIKLFDCLNSTYRKYITSLVWYCNKNDSMGGNPVSVKYECSMDNTGTTVVGMQEDGTSTYYTFAKEDTINEKFLLILKKQYGTLTIENSNKFKQECKNFSNITNQNAWEATVNEMIKAEIKDCASLSSPISLDPPVNVNNRSTPTAVKNWLWGGTAPIIYKASDEQIANSLMKSFKVRIRNLEGKDKDKWMTINHLLVEDVKSIFQEIYDQVPTFKMDPAQVGSYNFRTIISGKGKSDKLSVHAYGGAIDINSVINPLYDENTANTETHIGTTEHPVVQIFYKHGWTWGGIWDNLDKMHFEYCGAPKKDENVT